MIQIQCEKVTVGKYTLNQYHLEALKRMYDHFNSEGAMKVTWSSFLNMLKTGQFNKHEKIIDAFFA